MSRNSKPPRPTTPVNADAQSQLADLASLLGLMQAASKLSQDLDTLANAAGGSLEKIAERFGVPFFDIHNTYVREIAGQGKRPKRKAKRAK